MAPTAAANDKEREDENLGVKGQVGAVYIIARSFSIFRDLLFRRMKIFANGILYELVLLVQSIFCFGNWFSKLYS